MIFLLFQKDNKNIFPENRNENTTRVTIIKTFSDKPLKTEQI